MAEGRQKEAWGRTSTVLALIANVNRDPKKHRAFRPDDFNPFAPRRRGGVPLTPKTLRALKPLAKGRRGER